MGCGLVLLGLNELDVEGDWLVHRQVLWKVPKQLLDKSLTLKEENSSSARPKQSWNLDTAEQQRGEVSHKSMFVNLEFQNGQLAMSTVWLKLSKFEFAWNNHNTNQS